VSARQLVYKTKSVTVYYKPDRRSIARCAVGPELTDIVHDIVDNIAKPFAEAIAPEETGHYKRSFERTTTYVALGKGELMTRVAARLYNMDEGAAAIEWGTKQKGRRRARAGQHILGQTLAMLETAVV
jgi:hypothetical protein